MKAKAILTILISLNTLLCVFAQDETWEPQKQVTGYLTFEGNYFNNLKFFQRDYAVWVYDKIPFFN